MLKIGSHNTLTYLRPKKWWQIPFHFTAKCQRVDYRQQYEKYGVRLFDIRIWFDDNLNMEVKHGLMAFKTSEIYDFLEYLNDKGDCHLRVILEEDSFKKNDKEVSLKEEIFMSTCKAWETLYTRVKFFGGNREWDWKRLYQFTNQDEPLNDKYSSTTSLFKSKKRWLAVLDDLFPWLYARLNNKRNFQAYTENGSWLFVDFVDIR